jgi:hypothetical protein
MKMLKKLPPHDPPHTNKGKRYNAHDWTNLTIKLREAHEQDRWLVLEKGKDFSTLPSSMRIRLYTEFGSGALNIHLRGDRLFIRLINPTRSARLSAV